MPFFHTGGNINSEVQETIKNIEQMMKLTQDLIPKTEDVKAEQIGDMVESEMQMTSKAIEQAAKKIEVGSDLNLVLRKAAFCICENKDADQLRGNREADQRLCFRYIDSTMHLLSKSEISSI